MQWLEPRDYSNIPSESGDLCVALFSAENERHASPSNATVTTYRNLIYMSAMSYVFELWKIMQIIL